MSPASKQIFVGGVIVTALLAVAITTAVYFVSFFSQADANVKSALIASLVGLITLTATFIKERSKSRQEAHREKKVEAYTEFFNILSNINRKSNQDPENGVDQYVQSEEFLDSLFNLRKNVLLYGSPQVVKALGDWGKNSEDLSSDVSDPLKSLRPVGRLILAMRSDIGLSNFGLDEVSIHQVNVSDDLARMGRA